MTSDPNRIRRDIERTQDDLGSNVDALTDRMDPRQVVRHRKERARGAWQRVKENVMGSAQEARQTSGSRMSAASSTAQERMHGMQERMHDMGEASREQTQGHPLAAGLIAFGLGVLASALLPPSPPERRLGGRLKEEAQEHSGQFKQQATEAARQTRDNLREPAQHAAESVRGKAGQHAGELRAQTQATGQDLRGQAQQAAQNARPR